MRRENLFALDLGSTKFSIGGVLFKSNNELSRFDSLSVPAHGMKRGMVADFEKVKESISNLISMAEDHYETEIQKIVLGIGGNLLNTSRRLSDIEQPSNTIINDQSLQLLDEALDEALRETPDRQPLHRIALGYRIDGREFIANPIGFSGSRLSGQYFVIDADQAYLKDLVRLVNQCGIKVGRIYSSAFCSSQVCLDQISKEMGCAIVDLGGGTTEGIVYANGKPVETFWIGLGGHSITNDISIGLNLPLDEAERLKINFGLSGGSKEFHMDANTLAGATRSISSREIHNIIAPRAFEIAQNIAKALIPYKGTLGAGILLTGGACELSGLVSFFEERFRIPVKKVAPTFSENVCHSLKENSLLKRQFSHGMSSLVGLLNHELLRQDEEKNTQKLAWSKTYFGQIVNWFKDLS